LNNALNLSRTNLNQSWFCTKIYPGKVIKFDLFSYSLNAVFVVGRSNLYPPLHQTNSVKSLIGFFMFLISMNITRTTRIKRFFNLYLKGLIPPRCCSLSIYKVSTPFVIYLRSESFSFETSLSLSPHISVPIQYKK